MSASPWIAFYPSDWLAGTRGLSAAETGIYITLIASMYERCEPIPEDHKRLARLCGASTAAFVRCLDELIASGKIVRFNGGLWNNRVSAEIDFRSEKRLQARDAAESRWKKDKQNQRQDDADAMRAQSDRICKTTTTTTESPSLRSGEPAPEKRKSSIREDWRPSEANREYARTHGLDNPAIDREAEKFRDHHLKVGSVFKSWDAAWRTWVQRVNEFRSNGSHSAQGPPAADAPIVAQVGDSRDYVAQLLEERKARENADKKSGRIPGL